MCQKYSLCYPYNLCYHLKTTDITSYFCALANPSWYLCHWATFNDWLFCVDSQWGLKDMEYRLGLCCAPVTIILVTRCLLSRGFSGSYFTVALNGSQLLVLSIKNTFLFKKNGLFLTHYLVFTFFSTSSVCTIFLWNSTWVGPFKTPW